MQPYQRASEEIRRQGELPVTMLKKGLDVAKKGLIGASAAKSLSLADRALAFLNPHVPEKFSIAGLNKLDPRLGAFIKKATDEGVDYDETLRDFISEKAASEKNKEEKLSKESTIKQATERKKKQSLMEQEQQRQANPQPFPQQEQQQARQRVSQNFAQQQAQGQNGQMGQNPQQGPGYAALLAEVQRLQQARGQ